MILAAFLSVALAQEVLKPIVVGGDLDKQGIPLLQAPGSHSRHDFEEVRKKAAENIGTLLKQEPNVDFQGGPRGQAEKPQIRGMSSARVLILEDGVRQNFQNGHNGRVFADLSLIESLEVVKGPWSALYGSGAMGGVISFRRSTAADLIRRSGQNQGVEVAATGASAAEEFAQRVTGFAKVGWFEPLVSVRHHQASGVRLGNGSELSYSSSESTDLYSSLGFDLGDTQEFTLKLNRYQSDAQQPLDPATDTLLLTELGDVVSLKSDVVGDYRLVKDSYAVFAKPYFRKTELRKKRLSDRRQDIQLVETLGVDTWANLHWRLSEDVQLVTTTGLEYFRDKNNGQRNSGELASFPDGSGDQLGAYVQAKTALGRKLTLTPGLRYDQFRMKTGDGGGTADNKGDQLSFKAYAEYELLPGQRLFAGWGQAFNAPRLQDLYVSGMHFPGNFFVANPDLKPEKADTFEAGAKSLVQSGDLAFESSATYFVTRARDFIARSVDIPGGTTRFENLDRVKLEGFEVSANVQSLLWGAGLAYGQVRSLDLNSGEPLSDTAGDKWSARVEFFPLEGLSIGTDLVYAAAQKHVPAGVDETPAYLAQDIYSRYTRGPLSVQLRLNNLADRDYRQHGSAIREVGRDLRASASWLF